ncbi:MAG: MCE family protein [Myxococcaceae bacterium]|nr:MCE family protein [Myxococcaceae bacterium]MCA3013164.1 MCE family protein [Myxococcaceae bacterium]
MDESRLELKVGALMLAAVVGALALLWAMGELSFSSGPTVSVDFSHTGNVVKGAPVKLGGVVVGRVDAVELLPDRRDARGDPLPVRMAVSLSQGAEQALRSDCAITISSQGPLGEPYLELWPGNAAERHVASAPIRGVDAPRIDIVSNRLAKFLDSASRVLESDPEAVAKLVNGFGGLTTTVDGVLTENRVQLRELAQELAVAAKDVRVLAAFARKELEPGGRATVLLDDAAATARLARTELPELSKRASTALGGLAAVSGQLTEEDGQRLKAMLVKYQQAGEKVDALASRADKLLMKLEAGEGTLGALARDKQVYDDLKSLLADLRKNPWKMLWKD